MLQFSATSEAMLIREVLLFLVHGIGSLGLNSWDSAAARVCRREGMRTIYQFVNESSLATAGGEARDCHGERVLMCRKTVQT